MDFVLTEDQKMLKTMIREVAVSDIEPQSAMVDEEAVFPEAGIRKLAELGLMGIPFPEEYGGAGAGPLEFAIAVEEIARVCASTKRA